MRPERPIDRQAPPDSTPLELTVPDHPMSVRLGASVASWLGWAFFHALYRSCRIQCFGQETWDEVRRRHGGGVITVAWHESLFYSIYHFRNTQLAMLSSRSRDGEFIARFLHRFGYATPRGSSGQGKGGRDALSELVALVQRGHPAGIAIDAPRGPAYVAKFGAVAAAARAGVPIVGFCWKARRCLRLKNWDRTILPAPGTEIVALFGPDPLVVPRDASRSDLATARDRLDQLMWGLSYQTDHWFSMRDRFADPRQIPLPDPVPYPLGGPPPRLDTDPAARTSAEAT